MKADYLSYRRATNVSFLGLVIQLVLGLLLFVYAYVSADHAAMTAAIYMGIGLLAWIGLAIIFDQHRRERIEAFEAEAMSSSGVGESVFDEAGAELNVAARRLQAMYKYFAPGLSIVIGGLLVVVGIARFAGGRELLDPDAFGTPADHGFALLASLAVASSFVFARFVSGMSKQPVWQNLSAGASTIVGAALFALVIALGHFVDLAGTDTMLRWLQVILPVAMVVLGAEVFLNFLLELYRPRSSSDLPRMAFDSRILGFAAAPDRVAASIGEAINYQFGSDVTSSWAYRLLSRWIGVLVLFGALIAWLMTSFAVVQPHQRGMMLRFGRVVNPQVEPGLHVKWPWPVDRLVTPEFVETDERGRVVERFRTATAVRELQLGTPPPTRPGPVLWTNQHTMEERFAIVHAGEKFGGGGSEDASAENDLALVAVEVPVHYVVEDVELFERLGAPEVREDILRAVGRRAVMQHLAAKSMPELLGTGRDQIAAELREKIERAFARLNPDEDGEPRGAGVEILYVGALNPHPPQDAAVSFERVIVAEQNYLANLESAEAERIEALTQAVGSVDLAQEASVMLDEIASLQDRRDEVPLEERAGIDARILEKSRRLEERLVSEGGGEAASLLAEARARRWESQMSARGRASRYQGQLAAYESNPVVYKAILYFDMLSEVIQDARLYVVPDDVDSRIDLDLKDVSTSQDVFMQTDETGG